MRRGEQLIGEDQLGPPDVGERHLNGAAFHLDPYGVSGNAEETAPEMPALGDGPACLKARLEPGETLEVLEAHQRTVNARRAHFQGRGGKVFTRESIYRRMTEEDLDAKFAELVGMRAGEAKARELAGAVKGMADVANVSDVMNQLEMPEARIEEF